MRKPVLGRAYGTAARFHLRPQLRHHQVDVPWFQVLGLELVDAFGLEASVKVALEAGEGGMRAVGNRASVGTRVASLADR